MASSKSLSVRVKYQNQNKLFVCKRHELEEQISSHFEINLRNFLMFAVIKGERQQISLHDVTDLMKIEIVPPIDAQENMQEFDLLKKKIESMKSKLSKNTPLNGYERKMLIDVLEIHGMSLFKQKLKSINTSARANKKVQVYMPNKNSFAQTDPSSNASEVDTCVNNEDSNKDHQLILKKLWLEENPDMGEIDDLMDKTYEIRRIFIHRGPPVSVIKEEFPALFCVEQVKKELDRRFFPGKTEEFLQNMNIYKRHILHYKNSKADDIIKITEKAISHAKTPKQKSYAELVGSVFVLAKLLDENFGFIHLSDQPISAKIEDYDYPYIKAARNKLRDTFSDDIHYDIIVEDEIICKASNFCEAILCFTASFFIFGIVYPKNCRNTLIAFEKLYLKAKETEEINDFTHQLIKMYKENAISDKERGVTQ